jgi:ferric-dicitrate binding protein FerR (iron transport regulator)
MDERVGKYFDGTLPLDERVELLREAERNKTLKDELTGRYRLGAWIALADRPGDNEEARREYAAFVTKQRRKTGRRVVRRALAGLLTAACLVGLTWAVALWRLSPVTESEPTAYNILHVPAGQRLSFRLEDGTLVWLNAQSSLTYPALFGSRERRVEVEGEAYFEIAPDANRPFIVAAGNLEAKALGTAFNVYAYPGESYCLFSLLEGSLLVYNPSDPRMAVRLEAGQAAMERGGRFTVAAIRDDAVLWREGIYSFDNEPLGNILKKLEIYYDIAIEAKDPAMLQWRYTVKFRQRDGIDEIMRLLQRVHTFKLLKDEENNRITIQM